MIEAHKSAAFNFIARRMIARVLRRRFHNIYVAGAEHLQNLHAAGPMVGCVNHTNWWDGFVLYVLSHRFLAHEIYLAMEEQNLRRYQFFRWMGVFGIDLSGGTAALSGLRYAVGLLVSGRRPAALVWMFVQGALKPYGVPIEVKPGALFLARRTGAGILPALIRYEWMQESRPSIFVRIGEPLSPATGKEELTAILEAMSARITLDAGSLDLSGYKALFEPSMSMNRRWDRALHVLSGRPGKLETDNR